MIKFRLTKKIVPALISGVLFLAGCAAAPVIPEYNLKPEIKEEIFRITEGKQAGLTLQYSEIETTEGPEGLEAGKEFFEIINCKTLRDSIIGFSRNYNNDKGEELSKLIVDDFMKELEEIK